MLELHFILAAQRRGANFIAGRRRLLHPHMADAPDRCTSLTTLYDSEELPVPRINVNELTPRECELFLLSIWHVPAGWHTHEDPWAWHKLALFTQHAVRARRRRERQAELIPPLFVHLPVVNVARLAAAYDSGLSA